MHAEHPTRQNSLLSTRDNSTNMDPIQAAIDEIESREPGEDFSYIEIATRYGVNRSTLSRRHRGVTTTRAANTINQRKLNPQQEQELVRYIKRLTERHIPPTREMIQNFASTIAKEPVSESWVTRFINQHSIHLISQWTVGMDSNRHKANLVDKYRLYFNLRIFSRRMWEKKEVRASLQDGNRAWITLLACIYADGSALPPSLIYEAANKDIQSSWVEDIKAGYHEVFITSLSSGWTNNDIGLAWLKQLLNIAMFKPLLIAYSAELSRYLYRSQGLASITKGDFFPLFWNAWKASFKESTILSSFRATGISPPGPNPILNRFTQDQESGNSSSSGLSDHNWRKMDRLVRSAKLRQSLHHLSVENELLKHNNDGLRQALSIKKKPKLKKAAKLYKEKIQQEKRAAREAAKKAKEKERAKKSRKRQKRVVNTMDVREALKGASTALTKSTRSGRDVKLLDRFK
ncbi:hypothetical protein BU23DRAFT_585877 [Bimuria novae-zelandiae CBS 107.79]|uniref:HTH CENPB-type domain-containing protein n=1 Tax=Bimuria novae-zelandiae CBS 107.79 TaxID=1447943 RepID=A0A6A5VW94_9PLEO|nr:hypothetical protein BU23DRAFT_585877 [Bimuria novae-zelandiae CBS 107.79]